MEESEIVPQPDAPFIQPMVSFDPEFESVSGHVDDGEARVGVAEAVAEPDTPV